MPQMFGPPSIAAGVICLVLAGLLITVGQMHWPRVAVALVLTGVAGIINGTIGRPLHTWVTWTDHLVGQTIGRFTGIAIVGIIAIVVLGVFGAWIYHQKIDNATLAVTAAVPLVGPLLPGPIGTVAMFVIGIVPSLLGAGVSWLFFGRW